MSIDFTIRDVMHRISVRFVRAFLPGAKKPFYLKAVNQPELDIHGIASKAEVYNVGTSPRVIEEGLTAGMLLMNYLVADGYRIKTPLFNLRIRIPGEYSGNETFLLDGLYPRAMIQISAEFRKYLKEKVTLEFTGIYNDEGYIAEAIDEATGLVSEKMTRGNILVIQGHGLKIESDGDHEGEIGLFFTAENGASVKASVIPVNEPRMLKVVVPAELKTGKHYTLSIGTMSSIKGRGNILKTIRRIKSGFTLVA